MSCIFVDYNYHGDQDIKNVQKYLCCNKLAIFINWKYSLMLKAAALPHSASYEVDDN